MNAEQVCLKLLRADSEEEVIDILDRYGLNDGQLWTPLGDIENNLSIAGNQQSCADRRARGKAGKQH